MLPSASAFQSLLFCLHPRNHFGPHVVSLVCPVRESVLRLFVAADWLVLTARPAIACLNLLHPYFLMNAIVLVSQLLSDVNVIDVCTSLLLILDGSGQ